MTLCSIEKAFWLKQIQYIPWWNNINESLRRINNAEMDNIYNYFSFDGHCEFGYNNDTKYEQKSIRIVNWAALHMYEMYCFMTIIWQLWSHVIHKSWWSWRVAFLPFNTKKNINCIQLKLFTYFMLSILA